MKHISEAIAAVIADTPAGIGTTDKNPHFKYGYTSIDAVLKHLRSAMAKHGVSLCMSEENFESFTRGQKAALYVKVTFSFWLTWQDQETPKETLTQVANFKNAQSIGALRSYACKYWLRLKFMLALGEKDLDASTDTIPVQQSPGPYPPPPSPQPQYNQHAPPAQPAPSQQQPPPPPPQPEYTASEFEDFKEEAMNVASWVINRDLTVTGCAPPSQKEFAIITRFKQLIDKYEGDRIFDVLEAIALKISPVQFVKEKGLIDTPPEVSASEQEEERVQAVQDWLDKHGFTSTVLDWICRMAGVGLTPDMLGKTEMMKVESFIKKMTLVTRADPKLDVIEEISSAIKNGLGPTKWLEEVTTTPNP